MMNSGRRATPFDLADARGWNKSCPTLLCSSLKEIITRIDYRSCRAQYQRDPEKWVNCRNYSAHEASRSKGWTWLGAMVYARRREGREWDWSSRSHVQI